MQSEAVPAIVLAAGASQRLGQPKALALLDGVSFVARVAAALQTGGAAPVVVVTRPTLAGEVGPCVAPDAMVVVNEAPERGMQSSIVVGLDALASLECRGVMLALVDQPTLQHQTVRRLIEAFEQTPDAIVVPRSPDGRRGHPVVFPAALLPSLREAHAQGARAVLWRHPERVREVVLDDVGAFRDVNTPADLAALRAHEGQRGAP